MGSRLTLGCVWLWLFHVFGIGNEAQSVQRAVFPSQKADKQVLAAATSSLLLVVVSRRLFLVFFSSVLMFTNNIQTPLRYGTTMSPLPAAEKLSDLGSVLRWTLPVS